MMLSAALLAALSVAYPRPGQRLPPVERCYVIGAAPLGTTNVVVGGRSYPVYKTGAWTAMADVSEGENEIEVATVKERSSVRFFVEGRPKGGGGKAPEKVWKKIDGLADEPRPHPAGRPHGEILVAIDPGHGGETDTGAYSPHGIPEKVANLKVALEVRDALAKLGFRTVMTRESDVALTLPGRPLAAKAAGADAFVSIHHNAPAVDRDPGKVRFHSVYAWNDIGKDLAGAVSSRLAEALDGEVESRGVQHANFAVTRNPEIPSCLVEVDFITSPEGEEAIFDPCHRKIVAEAIAAGVADWCKPR